MDDRKIRWIKKRPWLWIGGAVLLLIILWNGVSDLYREQDKDLRRQLRETVKEQFPEQNAKFSQTFGLFPVETNRKIPGQKRRKRGTVILVHGLDDPGKVWRNLAPALIEENFDVWRMVYPNDQPIVESARFFFEVLKKLKAQNIQRTSIVAHSMGGLVSRELLTSPEIDYRGWVRNGKVPSVETLIMVGTPNHGSPMARFRVLAEMRDHLARLTKGEAAWLGAIFDGAGEAKIDLLPGSRFLTTLNARPHPPEVDQLVIAGVLCPWNAGDIARWREKTSRAVPDDLREEVDTLAGYMTAMTSGLGDGVVTVASTRLEGVSHRSVEGSHLTMIRNITADSRRVPPAVPIIIDKLIRRP
jgi:pimeloyl-ACP methyl ester carboxylesterase